MIRIIVPLLLAMELTGCASKSHPLPRCDGYSRRPINRAMWQWEEDNPARQRGNAEVPATGTGQVSYLEELLTEKPPALAYFDIAGSYRSCQEG
ncbi:hypothetical protein Rleg9DRAFT_0463 [Rhizobium leguminosarum bv. trifolii WSM597]|uniref:Type IV secretion system protein VirB7 n=1 Tax=Rhizobium leguminosarum bv. trifolii WSM597 TaxID=754764 RepID=J0GVU6_RHILT|nr:hypothetical protein [Rhizobium leguminosarum]EJB01725.1 hypothetical protein Rleg9DRAFT_0463 [Rhizobium leguminosarum bv. trifolii WSM597]